MRRQLDAFSKNKTWKRVPLPHGRKAIKRKWVFKIKNNKRGNMRMYKSKVRACGSSQRDMIDYMETCALLEVGIH
jgi:hypothetical protein